VAAAGAAAAVVVTMLVAMATPAAAAAPAIVNAGSGSQWLESFAVPKDTNGERIFVTYVVKHDLGVQVTGLAVDDDWNGTDNTSTIAADAVTATLIPGGASNYSAVRYSFVPPNQPGFSCGLFSGTRRVNNTLRVRAVTSDGQRTAVVSANVHSVENNQCLAVTDYPYLRDQSQSATAVTPGTTVSFSFQGDDVDSSGSNDSLDKMRWRVRRLNDGAIVQGPTCVTGLDDNTTETLNVAFSSRGRFVVEAELGGEDDGCTDFDNGGQFFRLGAVDVNSAASTSPTVSLSDPGVIQSTPTGSVPVTITATPADSDVNGRVQMIRWDADNNGIYERRELAADETTGLTAAQRSDTQTLTGCANRTWQVEVTDNGALNAADTIRRTLTTSRTVEVNCPPVTANAALTVDEDTPGSVALSATDPDGNPLTWTITSPPAHGTASISGSTFSYTPDADYNGSDSATVEAADGRGGTDAAAVAITVRPVNDPPVATDVDTSTAEDQAVTVPLAGAVSDVDGDTLTVTVTTPPAHGSATPTGATTVEYDPAADFNGTDSFVYTVSDGHGGTDTGVVTVVVDPVDDAPVAADQTLSTPEETAVAVVLGPDVDADGETLTYALVSSPAHGVAEVDGTGATYTPEQDFNGTDSFVFSVTDGTSVVMGTITVDVTPVNDAPVADDQSVVTDEDTPVVITLTASDVDGDDLAFTVTTAPQHGTLDTTSGPAPAYTPDQDYFGPDAFVFTVDDGHGGVDTAIVSIEVRPVNDAPVADDQAVATGEDQPVPILLSASDVDGDDLTYAVVDPPAHGTLSGTAPNLVYTPTLNESGTDSFTFVVSDGELTDTATVTIEVEPLNDPPSAHPQSVSTPEDTALPITLTGSDPDGDVLTFTVVSSPAHGTLDTTAGADVVYTPAPDFNGSDGFVFRVVDPSGASDTATVVISVGEPGSNDPPTADDQAVTTAEDTPVAVELTADDVDGDPLTYAIEVAPQHGTVALSGSSVVYTPALNVFGDDVFVFRVDDGAGGVAFGVVEIVVTAVNDAPDAIPQVITLLEDTPTAVTLTATDVDGDELSFAVTAPPANGTLAGTAPDLTYTPAPDAFGVEYLTFVVDDGHGGTDTAVVTLDVRPAPAILTKLFAEGALATVQPGPVLTVNIAQVRAHLTDRITGTPIAGRWIRFTAGTGQICAAVTDENGAATCSGIVPWATTLISLGYTAIFDGDADHMPTSDAGPLIQLNKLPII
jgi:hypothetical protein